MTEKGLYGRCGRCGHDFLVARLPMLINDAARLAARAGCPGCGETDKIKAYCAEADASAVLIPEQLAKAVVL